VKRTSLTDSDRLWLSSLQVKYDRTTTMAMVIQDGVDFKEIVMDEICCHKKTLLHTTHIESVENRLMYMIGTLLRRDQCRWLL